jgi:hypothetical protein
LPQPLGIAHGHVWPERYCIMVETTHSIPWAIYSPESLKRTSLVRGCTPSHNNCGGLEVLGTVTDHLAHLQGAFVVVHDLHLQHVDTHTLIHTHKHTYIVHQLPDYPHVILLIGESPDIKSGCVQPHTAARCIHTDQMCDKCSAVPGDWHCCVRGVVLAAVKNLVVDALEVRCIALVHHLLCSIDLQPRRTGLPKVWMAHAQKQHPSKGWPAAGYNTAISMRITLYLQNAVEQS